MRTIKLIMVAYLVMALLATYYLIANYPLEITANLIFDDAYYYLGVAQNIAEGKGSTFGNVVQTNGYQPLWLIVLASVIYIFSFQKLWALASVSTLIFLVKSFSIFKLSTLKNTQTTPLLLSVALVIMMYPGIFSEGLETVLLLLCLPLLGQLKEFPEQFSIKTCLKYSLIFTLLFLVRLDLLAIMAAFFILQFYNIAKGNIVNTKNLAVTFMLTAIAISIYFIINYQIFGTIVPISGLSKSIGNRVGENYDVLLKYLISGRLAIIALALNFILAKTLKVKPIDAAPFSKELKLTLIAALIVASYYAFFSGWPLWSWYYWPTALVTLYAIANLIHLIILAKMKQNYTFRLKFVIFTGWLFLAYVSVLAVKTEISTGIFKTVVFSHFKKEFQPNYTIMNIRLIDDFFMNAPDGIVAMGDRAGGLGFWLPERFKFFHTEGLVANKDYLLARKTGNGVDFLKKLGIKYFIVERERLLDAKLEDGSLVHGIVEPIQGLSAHSGLVLICLPENSILFTQNYNNQIRYVYDFTKVTNCPDEISSKANALSEKYGELRKFSLPSEYNEHKFIKRFILNPA